MEGFLGVQIGEYYWLLFLMEIGEVLDYQLFVCVLFMQLWYFGLVNVCGNLLGVIDFGLFCGEVLMGSGSGVKIVVLFKDLQWVCVIVVLCVVGLCSLSDLQFVEVIVEEGCFWLGCVWCDVYGMQWCELDVWQLLVDLVFLQVGCSCV